MLTPETQSYLANNKIEISLLEYFLLRFKEPTKPAYLNFNTVEKLIATPNWDAHFMIMFNHDIKLGTINQLITLPRDTVFQTWLIDDYRRSNVAKDKTQLAENDQAKAQKEAIEQLTKKLHTQLIKVRAQLIQRGASSLTITNMIELAMNPYSVLGKDYIMANMDSLNDEQRARIQKGFDMRRKFGIEEILKQLGK